MPRLSDYLAAAATAAAAPAAAVAAPRAGAEPVSGQPSAASSSANAAFASEVARLQRQYQHRLRDNGPRLFRHEDGSLLPQPPAPEPLTVANRCKYNGLVKHCLQQPGVDQHFERTGVSARRHANSSFEQHQAALTAIGLHPEYDAAGSWHGFDARQQDPLAPPAGQPPHPLAMPEWRELTKSVLDKAVELHGPGIIDRDGWQAMRSAVQEG